MLNTCSSTYIHRHKHNYILLADVLSKIPHFHGPRNVLLYSLVSTTARWASFWIEDFRGNFLVCIKKSVFTFMYRADITPVSYTWHESHFYTAFHSCQLIVWNIFFYFGNILLSLQYNNLAYNFHSSLKHLSAPQSHDWLDVSPHVTTSVHSFTNVTKPGWFPTMKAYPNHWCRRVRH